MDLLLDKFAKLGVDNAPGQEALQKAIKADLMKNMPTPPAGNQTNIDYSKQIAAAQASGNMVLMASLIRQQAAANAPKQ